MTEPVHIDTAQEGLFLQEFATPDDDLALRNLALANQRFWQRFAGDVLAGCSSLSAIRNERTYAHHERELRLGLWQQKDLVGWASVMDHSEHDPEVGNWLGMWLDKNSAGHGLAAVAGRATIKYLRATRQNGNITTTTDTQNTAAIKALERAGFTAVPAMPYQAKGHRAFRLPASEAVRG